MIWNELKNDFHAFLKISVSPTFGPSSRGSGLENGLENGSYVFPIHLWDSCY